MSNDEYANNLHTYDIYLDCYPYNSTTCMLDALYCDVPVITLSLNDDRHRSKIGKYILTEVGLAEQFVAESYEDYVNKCVEYLQDNCRVLCRQRLIDSSIMNYNSYCENFESVLLSLLCDCDKNT